MTSPWRGSQIHPCLSLNLRGSGVFYNSGMFLQSQLLDWPDDGGWGADVLGGATSLRGGDGLLRVVPQEHAARPPRYAPTTTTTSWPSLRTTRSTHDGAPSTTYSKYKPVYQYFTLWFIWDWGTHMKCYVADSRFNLWDAETILFHEKPAKVQTIVDLHQRNIAKLN